MILFQVVTTANIVYTPFLIVTPFADKDLTNMT
jgi:hypothetical protein